MMQKDLFSILVHVESGKYLVIYLFCASLIDLCSYSVLVVV